MRIFNADGSEAKMCGNGIRCVGKYVYDKGIIGKTHLTVETLSGIKTLDLSVEDGKVKKVTVDMGKSVVSEPMTLTVKGENVRLIPVSMGNPHAVIFVDDAEKAEVAEVGSAIEHDAAFPDGVNVEFVSVMDRNNLRMRVWERGSGITMACGTGACAAVSAAVKVGFCGADENVRVHLDGGTLAISVAQDSQVTMTGGAEMIYEGETVE
jgi:diaminopimelate epimerase